MAEEVATTNRQSAAMSAYERKRKRLQEKRRRQERLKPIRDRIKKLMRLQMHALDAAIACHESEPDNWVEIHAWMETAENARRAQDDLKELTPRFLSALDSLPDEEGSGDG
jgi:hypothetical protein